ncbi:MAG: DUF1573 domain-containing protein [Planctomycetaceae bacterium]
MTVRSHMLRAAAVAVVFAPFALSVAAHAVPDAPVPSPTSERPALRFGEYLVNLGRLPEGMTARGVFRFKNSGDAPLTIGDLAASCGCLTPRLEQKTYAPGEVGMFLVNADTAGEVSLEGDSLKQHYIDVPYTIGEERKTARVHLKFVLPERHVVVEPRSLLVYQFGAGPTRREITITDHRVPPLKVTGVECLDPALTVEQQLTESPDGPIRATIAVTVLGSLDREVRTRVVIHTDAAEQPEIHVPILVQVRSEGPAQVGGVPLELLPESTTRK